MSLRSLVLIAGLPLVAITALAVAGAACWNVGVGRDSIRAATPQSTLPLAKVSSPPIEPRYPPGYNFALQEHGGRVTGGVNSESLNDGIVTGYTGGTGYGHTQWNATPPQSFLVTLKEPSEIDCVRFLLWDLEEDRFYRYKVEISGDSQPSKWMTVADKTATAEECRGWQVIKFARQPVKVIRLTGTYNSANSGFHVVELQACIAPPHGFPGREKAAEVKPVENLEF